MLDARNDWPTTIFIPYFKREREVKLWAIIKNYFSELLYIYMALNKIKFLQQAKAKKCRDSGGAYYSNYYIRSSLRIEDNVCRPYTCNCSKVEHSKSALMQLKRRLCLFFVVSRRYRSFRKRI